VSNTPLNTDVLIIGAGPVGLFQIFQLGLHEIKVHVVDSLPSIGGQCSALYPDKFIYDVPGIPKITGKELIDQLALQIEPLKPIFHLKQTVKSLLPNEMGYEITTQGGLRFQTKCVVIAAGVGAFVHKELPLPELTVFRSTSPESSHPPQVVNEIPQNASSNAKQIVVYGSSEVAVRTALEAAQKEATQSVCLVYRREQLDINEELKGQFNQALKSKAVQFVVGQITGLKTLDGGSTLTHVVITETSGALTEWPCDLLVECLGLSPKLGPLVEWEIQMEKKTLKVDPENFETNLPGIYAVGDINTYAGKRKLIVCGFHEATLAAYSIASHLRGGQAIPLEYTTASARIHKLLGL